MAKNVLELKPNEEIVGLVRKSVWTQWARILLILVWVLLPFFFFFPLLSVGVVGLSIFFSILLTGLLYSVRRWRMWQNTIFLITDQRVVDIDQIGMFKREITDVEYENVKEVVVRKKGIFRRLFNVGAVRIRTKKIVSYDLQVTGIRQPDHVADLIDEVQLIKTSQKNGETFHAKKIA